MPLSTRVIFFSLIGIIAGIVAWPFSELLIHAQSRFPTLMLYNIAMGLVAGFLVGGCFGTSEGILTVSGAKTRGGLGAGLVIGLAGGAAGVFAGQAALLSIGTVFFNSAGGFQRFGVPLSRALGWSVFGIFIGLIEGARSLSIHKMRNGVLGGFIGGLLGGLFFEYMRIFRPGGLYTRLVGFVLLGFFIGLFYGFIENRLTRASLVLLNGRFRGREFPLTQRFTRVGGSDKTEVGVQSYKNVADVHVEVTREKGEYVLTDAGSKTGTFVNDSRVEKTVLHEGDVIRAGDAQFQFRKK
jgi:hypothetical protein